MKIGGIIRGWYEKNKRDLPWRHTFDPYRIWLSEIILQQTRVAQGIEYYNRFLQSFPDLFSLAAASEDEVLKLWQGLGYYSRAKNLHAAARDMVENRGGTFPSTRGELLELKGVGEYTAAAISSVCFGEPVAVVDGNVARVIARLFGVEDEVNTGKGSRIVASLARELLEEGASPDLPGQPFVPGTHNQAMMEFGALMCVPSNPDCPSCPLKEHCRAFLAGSVHSIPVRKPKKKPLERWMYFYVLTDGHRVILSRRGNGDIWKSLYQFPVYESTSPLSVEEIPSGLERVLNNGVDPGNPEGYSVPESLADERTGSNHIAGTPVILRMDGPVKHQLTHRTLYAHFIQVRLAPLPSLPSEPVAPPGFFSVPLEDLDIYPVPRLIERYMEEQLTNDDRRGPNGTRLV